MTECSIRTKVKKCETNTTLYSMHYWGYASLEVKGWWALLLPPLPPHHSGPATRDFHSSISVEVLLWGCNLNVQGLLHQQLLSSVMIQYSGFLPVDGVVVLPCMVHRLLHHYPLASVPSASSLVFVWSVPDVDLAAAAGDTIYLLLCILHLSQHWAESPLRLKDYSDLEPPANMPDVLTYPSHIRYHHQWSLLFLLFLVWAACVCCFLWGVLRIIIILLEDSSIVVNYLLKVVLHVDDPSGSQIFSNQLLNPWPCY